MSYPKLFEIRERKRLKRPYVRRAIVRCSGEQKGSVLGSLYNVPIGDYRGNASSCGSLRHEGHEETGANGCRFVGQLAAHANRAIG